MNIQIHMDMHTPSQICLHMYKSSPQTGVHMCWCIVAHVSVYMYIHMCTCMYV